MWDVFSQIVCVRAKALGLSTSAERDIDRMETLRDPFIHTVSLSDFAGCADGLLMKQMPTQHPSIYRSYV